MKMILNNILNIEMKTWLKRRNGSSNVVCIAPDLDAPPGHCYLLFTAYDYEAYPDYLGRILFDEAGCWIYDGEELSIDQQEQIAAFITGFGKRG